MGSGSLSPKPLNPRTLEFRIWGFGGLGVWSEGILVSALPQTKMDSHVAELVNGLSSTAKALFWASVKELTSSCYKKANLLYTHIMVEWIKLLHSNSAL